ncbi:MAG TPA: hypothetical protein VMA86_04595 [Acetobacteraceae bacterium]|nr:hypothetical protein [Acetobacteraceae bacterium]
MAKKRRKRYRRDNPYRVPADEIHPISVSQPADMLEVFRELTLERRDCEKLYVPVRQLYDDAVTTLLEELDRKTPIRFVPTPASGNVRRTVWLRESIMKDVMKAISRHNVHASTLVLTAFLRFLARKGITFEGFPTGL